MSDPIQADQRADGTHQPMVGTVVKWVTKRLPAPMCGVCGKTIRAKHGRRDFSVLPGGVTTHIRCSNNKVSGPEPDAKGTP